MSILVCIDDTDNIDSIGTGTVADYIKAEIESALNFKCTPTTRHQLLIHEDIPYTSHNSSMCFTVSPTFEMDEAELNQELDRVKQIAINIILENKALGSDPGLCIVVDPSDITSNELIQFGKEAKKQIKTKEEAYQLANLCGVHLSEHGGTGGGIIGALAGVGLRLSGNDGEVKASLKEINSGVFGLNEIMNFSEVDVVRHLHSNKIIDNGKIEFINKSKTVLRNHEFTLYVIGDNQKYTAVSKKMIRKMEMGQSRENAEKDGCRFFIADVEEERIDELESCANCSYRKWLDQSFLCTKKKADLE